MWIWTPVVRFFASTQDTPVDKGRRLQVQASRRIYAFGLFAATLTHIGAICISLLATISPHLFAKNVALSLRPSNLFMPVWPTTALKVATLEQGAHIFLQWDMLIMFCTFLIWTFWARGHVESSLLRKVLVTVRGLGYCVLVGPIGASLLAMWERDEMLFEEACEETASGKRMES
ncbi:unnamed protein product [Aureobasidium vineae]|uniref:Uncharacterized protein n=1 Tax=Aureobasidium vineae TaxID=2773715 RepID=A0A9N8PE35_9PEZI|nr:unnamed protein product [Aureobasidium vineae]